MSNRYKQIAAIHKKAALAATDPVLQELRDLGLGGAQQSDPSAYAPGPVTLDELRNMGLGGTPGVPRGTVGLQELRDLGLGGTSSPASTVGQRDLNARPISTGDNDANTSGLVSEIQILLEKHGYILSQHGRDGSYGDETLAAVKEFQINNNVGGNPPSGKIDNATMEKLKSANPVKRKFSTESAGEVGALVGGVAATAAGGPKKIAAAKLYADLMAGIGNPNLCKAMVANAIAESALNVHINGDCGSYAKKKGSLALDTSLYPNIFMKPKRGKCCSFGLWQYNICGGLGNGLLKAYGVTKDSSDQEKIAVLTSYKKQLDFMISHVNKKAPLRSNKSVDEWVDWFVRKVERPAKMDKAVVHRQKIARGLNFA